MLGDSKNSGIFHGARPSRSFASGETWDPRTSYRVIDGQTRERGSWVRQGWSVLRSAVGESIAPALY